MRAWGATLRSVAMMLRPSPSGMLRSSRMRSGCKARAWVTASAPLPASPTTLSVGWASMSSRSPERRIAWSSTIKICMMSSVMEHLISWCEQGGAAHQTGAPSGVASADMTPTVAAS